MLKEMFVLNPANQTLSETIVPSTCPLAYRMPKVRMVLTRVVLALVPYLLGARQAQDQQVSEGVQVSELRVSITRVKAMLFEPNFTSEKYAVSSLLVLPLAIFLIELNRDTYMDPPHPDPRPLSLESSASLPMG